MADADQSRKPLDIARCFKSVMNSLRSSARIVRRRGVWINFRPAKIAA